MADNDDKMNVDFLLSIVRGEADVSMLENADISEKNRLLIEVVGNYVESNLEVVKLLLESGADVNAQGNDGNTALGYAFYRMKNDVVGFLLEQKDIKLDIQNHHGETAAMIAFKDGKYSHNKASLYLLIDKNADITTQNNEEMNLLMMAVSVKDSELVERLLGKKFNKNELSMNEYVNTKNKYGTNALMLAANCLPSPERREIIDLLLGRNIDVDAQNNQGWSALMLACRANDVDLVEALLNKNADIFLKNSDGRTALDIHATRKGAGAPSSSLIYWEKIKTLLEKATISALIMSQIQPVTCELTEQDREFLQKNGDSARKAVDNLVLSLQDVIFLHVLAHTPNLWEMLKGETTTNKEDGYRMKEAYRQASRVTMVDESCGKKITTIEKANCYKALEQDSKRIGGAEAVINPMTLMFNESINFYCENNDNKLSQIGAIFKRVEKLLRQDALSRVDATFLLTFLNHDYINQVRITCGEWQGDWGLQKMPSDIQEIYQASIEKRMTEMMREQRLKLSEKLDLSAASSQGQSLG